MKNKTIRLMLCLLVLSAFSFVLASCEVGQRKETSLTIILESTVVAGEKCQASVVFTPVENAAPVVWSTSDQNIATIDQNGLITTYNSGTVIIIVSLESDESITTTKTLTVTPVPAGVDGNYIDNGDHWVLFTGVRYNFSSTDIKLVDENNPVLDLVITDGKAYLYPMQPGEAYISNLDETATFKIVVTPQIISFGLGDGITSFNNLTNQNDFRGDKDEVMYVGVKNVFKFDLSVTTKVFNEMLQVVNVYPEISELDLNYHFIVEGNVIEFDDIATHVEGGIKFNESFVGKKVTVTITNQFDDFDEFAASYTFTLNDGYNVYDNLDLKHYYGDVTVEKINILRDIKAELLPEQLYEKDGELVPYNSYSASDEAGGKQGSVYLRYNASSIGHLVIEGNYFTVNAEGIPLAVGSDAGDQGGFVDSGRTVVSVISAIFRAAKDGKTSTDPDDSSVTYNNLKVIGNSNRPDVNDVAISGGYLNLRYDNVDGYVNNVVTTYGVIGINIVGLYTNCEVNDSIITDFWASSVILWTSGVLKITNTFIGNAGGSAICLIDLFEDTTMNPNLIVDDLSVIQNYTHGNSPWFVGYGLTVVSSMISGIEYNLGLMHQAVPTFNKTILVESESTSSQEIFNFAIMIQNENPMPGQGALNMQPQASVTIAGKSVMRPYNYLSVNPMSGAFATANQVIFMPYASDFETPFATAIQYLMSQQVPQEMAFAQAFASTFISMMMAADNPYIEIMPAAFKCMVIVPLYNKTTA